MEEPTVTIALLRLFDDVAKAGSLAATARERGIDPSIVSRHIGVLESAIGFRLFDRTTRRLQLTEAGQIYLDRSRVLVDELLIAQQEAADMVAQPKGILRVTASNAFGERWLMPRLQTFCEANPNINLDLKLTDSTIDIASEGIDVAIRLIAKPEGSLVTTKLMDTQYRVVASPEYVARAPKITKPEHISEHLCLLLPLPGYRSLWRFRQKEDISEVSVHGRIVASSPQALHRAALDGLGPTLLANWMVDKDIQQKNLIEILPEWGVSAGEFDTAAWLLYPSKKYVPRKTRLFIDYLKDLVSTTENEDHTS